MATRFASSSSIGPGGTQIQNANETVFAALGPLIPTFDNALIVIMWYLSFVVPTSGTAAIIRVRRSNAAIGSTAPSGTVVNVASSNTVVAANVVALSGLVNDSPGIATDISYAVSIQITGGASVSNINDYQAFALCL